MTETADSDLRRARAKFAAGNFAGAFDDASRSLTHAPQDAQAHALRANAALKLERWQEAITDLVWLLERQPNHAAIRRNLSTCWMRLGNRHKDNANTKQADYAYRNALAANPHNADARFNFGMLLLETARISEALEHLRAANAEQHANNVFALKYVEALLAIGDKTSAIDVLDGIARRGGTRDELQQCCRLLLHATSRDAAIALARRLIEHNPETHTWAREFSRQLRKDSDLPGSREMLGLLRSRTTDAAERLRIDIADALGLPSTYAGHADLQAVRDGYAAGLENLIAAYPSERVARMAPPPEALLWDNFLLAYQGENDRDLQRKFGTWLNDSLQALLPQFARTRTRRARALPRLAMVSGRFHQCTVGSYFTSWVEYLAQAGWELLLVHVGDFRDALSARLAHAAHREVALSGSLTEAARTLHELDADIILYPELGMDLRALGLAALRLAPIQVCGWGHPDTTGLPTIDAFFSCAEMEPADTAAHYTERLLTLPGLGTRYLGYELPARATRAAIGLPEQGTLYLVPQSLFKLHPDNDNVLADVARRDASAVFVFFASKESGSREVFEDRLTRTFTDAGLASAGRWLFLPPRARADYLQVNMACDVMLDTLHFSGGNTSLDALHAGLPIVTCPGRFMRGRQSMAMLKHLRCDELIADTPQQLAELAVQIAHDRSRHAALNERIRAGLPELTQSDAPLHALDAHLKSLLAGR